MSGSSRLGRQLADILVAVQRVINNPRRTQDLENIRALLRANKSSLNMIEVREYFCLFDKEALLKELLDET